MKRTLKKRYTTEALRHRENVRMKKYLVVPGISLCLCGEMVLVSALAG
jgi:hypothetical protein